MALSKTQKLVSAWLDFTELAENQEIDIQANDFDDPKDPKTDLQIDGNTLKISPSYFEHLKVMQTKEQSGQGQQRGIYLTFPVYPKYQKSQSRKSKPIDRRTPLFGIDLANILSGEYIELGWDLTQQPSFCAMRNIVSVFAEMDHEDISRLDAEANPLSLLSVLIHKYADKKVHSYSELLFVLPDVTNRRAKSKLPYVYLKSDTVLSHQLKRDLRDAMNASMDDVPLVREFLYGQTQSDVGQRTVVGRFGKIPATTQREALVHQYNHSLSAVQGPPGSGKTTLILNAIATKVIQSYFLKRNELPIVITSATNKAVENVRDKFQEMGLLRSFLELGNKKKSEAGSQVIEELIEDLQSDSVQDVQEEYQTVSSAADKLWEALYVSAQDMSNKLKTLSSDLSQIAAEIEQHELRESQFGLPEIDRNTFRKGVFELQTLIGQIKGRGFFARIFRGKGLTRSEFQLGMSAFQLFIESGVSLPFKETEMVGRIEWESLWDDILTIKERFEQRDSLRQVISRIRQEENEKRTLANDTAARLSAHQDKLFEQEFHEMQEKLFYHVVRLNLLNAKLHKQQAVKALNRYKEFLSGTGGISAEDLSWVYMCFPCIGTTLHSFRRCFPFSTSVVGKLIVDEAGMISVNQVFPAVYRSNAMLVVGDTKQLEPIVGVVKEDEEKYRQRCFYNQGLTDDDYYTYSPLAKGTATSQHIASGVTRNNETSEVLLKEHFRCVPPIARCFDDISKYGLDIKKEDVQTPFGTNLLAYHVDGFMSHNRNLQEKDAIVDVLEHLLQNGYAFEDIGIITPFRNQLAEIKKAIQKKSDLPFEKGFLSEQVGTVHTFQGAEYKVIIFSSVLGYGSSAGLHMYARPNFLNVAVSRAQELFILVGNLNILEETNNPHIGTLLKHIHSEGKVAPLPEPIRFQYGNSVNELIENCEHVNVLNDAFLHAQHDITIVSPWIGGEAAEHFLNMLTPNDVRFHIVYGYGGREDEKRHPFKYQDELKQRVLQSGGTFQNLVAERNGQGTHQKILIVDREYAVIGSWNWLSHGYGKRCMQRFNSLKDNGVLIRNETSVLTRDQEIINQLLENLSIQLPPVQNTTEG